MPSEYGEIHLSELDGKIAYSLLKLDGGMIRNQKTDIDAPTPFNMESLSELKDEILKSIAREGHILLRTDDPRLI